MKSIAIAAFFALPALFAGPVARAESFQVLPSDRETTVNGVEVACSGVGDEAREDPRWTAYPVRIEFANARAEYLSDLDISIATARGVTLVSARCESPWFLAKLPPGTYKVSATFKGSLTKTAKFTSPAVGQSRTIVRFPEIGLGQ